MNNEQFLALYDEIKNIRVNIVHQLSRLATIEKIIMEVIKETTPNIPAEEIKKEESE